MSDGSFVLKCPECGELGDPSVYQDGKNPLYCWECQKQGRGRVKVELIERKPVRTQKVRTPA